MTKRKAGRPKGDKPPKGNVLVVKGSSDWKEWLDGLADHCRLGLADTVEQGMLYYAKERGYAKPPPKR